MKISQPNLFEFSDESEMSLKSVLPYRFECPSMTREESLAELENVKRLHPKIRNKKSGEISFAFPRQKKIIADFSLGYAKNWAFQLHGVFAKCLDIKDKELCLKEIANKEKPYKNQGSLFNFSSGQMIYDSIFAYSDLPWRDCIKHVKVALKIQKSEPVWLLEPGNIRHPGLVEGIVFENIEGQLVEKKKFSMSQDDFVRALINGFEEA